jgi:hypothetical protein
MPPFATIALVLILARAIGELWLSRLNQRHVWAHADEVPPAFREMVDELTYRRSVDYTLAKSRFGEFVTLFDAALLIGILFSGVLPWAFESFTAAGQWLVFFSPQALHQASSVCQSRGTRSSNSKTDSVSIRPQ